MSLLHQPTRRSLFGILTGGAMALAAADPERALWVPGRRKVFVPARGKAQHVGVDFIVQPGDESLSLDQYYERYLLPAIICVASRLDEYLGENYRLTSLPLPFGVLASGTLNLSAIHHRMDKLRQIETYDPMNGHRMRRIDAYAVPTGVTA